MTDDELPPALRPRKPRPLMSHTFAMLGWAHRCAQAIGSDRFEETASRAANVFAQSAQHAHTPGEGALITGLQIMLDELVAADAEARLLLAESVSGMNAADATEFVELIEGDDQAPLP